MYARPGCAGPGPTQAQVRCIVCLLSLVHTSATAVVRQCDRRTSDCRMSCRSATSGRLATRQRRMVSYDNTTVVHTYPIRRALFFSTRNLFLLASCADAQIELFLPTNLTISAYPVLAGLLQDCCTAVSICYGILRSHCDEHVTHSCAYQLF